MRPSANQQINLRISEELLARIDAKARETGIDRSALLRLAATQFIEGAVHASPAPSRVEQLEKQVAELNRWREALSNSFR
jgi:predicted DNA-binding protein